MKYFVIAVILAAMGCTSKSTSNEPVDSVRVDSLTAQSSTNQSNIQSTVEAQDIGKLNQFLARVKADRMSVFLPDKGVLYSGLNPMSMMNYYAFSKNVSEIVGAKVQQDNGEGSGFDKFLTSIDNIPQNFAYNELGIDPCGSYETYWLGKHNGGNILSISYESFLGMAGQDEQLEANLQAIKTNLDPLVTHDLAVQFGATDNQLLYLLFYLAEIDAQFYVVGIYELDCEPTGE